MQEKYKPSFLMIRKLKQESVEERVKEIAEGVAVDYGNGGTY
jgi:hypothetical protein